MQDVKRTPGLLLFSLGFYVKLYEGTINFQYRFLKVISVSGIFSSFIMSNLLKMVAISMKHKISKKSHIFQFFDEGFVTNFMKKLPFLIQISNVHVSICYIA